MITYIITVAHNLTLTIIHSPLQEAHFLFIWGFGIHLSVIIIKNKIIIMIVKMFDPQFVDMT